VHVAPVCIVNDGRRRHRHRRLFSTNHYRSNKTKTDKPKEKEMTAGKKNDPMARFAAAADERNADTAALFEKQLHLNHKREQSVAEEANLKMAHVYQQESHDEVLAERLQEQEKNEIKAAIAHSLMKSPQRLQTDAKLARQLAKEDAEAAKKMSKGMKKAAKNDAAVAQRLQQEFENEQAEVDWKMPKVNYEQRSECLMFWVKLPSLHHADVCVDHDAEGNASINIEAIPQSDTKVMRKFLVDLKLQTTSPLAIKNEDVSVAYDGKTSLLEIRCEGLRLARSTTSKTLASKLRGLFNVKGSNNDDCVRGARVSGMSRFVGKVQHDDDDDDDDEFSV
jgi:hypothetical protein